MFLFRKTNIGSPMDSLWVPSGSPLGPLWVPSGSPLDTLWIPFGSFLGPLQVSQTWDNATQGDLTPNFPTFAKPVLNLEFYMNADPESTQVSNIQENNVESCTNLRFCHQAPLLQLRLFLWPIFGQKFFFYKTNIEDRQKVQWKSAPLITICIFKERKNIFLQIIWDF